MKYWLSATPDEISEIVGTAISKTRIVMAIAKTPSVIAECLSVILDNSIFAMIIIKLFILYNAFLIFH